MHITRNGKKHKVYGVPGEPQPVPAIAVAPGFSLGRDLEALGVPHSKAARKLGLTIEELEALLAGAFPIRAALAERIAKLVGGSAQLWLDLQHRYETHPKHPTRGGVRVGAGRKRLGLTNKTVRLAASPEDMPIIEAWLNAQDSAAQALAQLVLQRAKRAQPPKVTTTRSSPTPALKR